MEFEPPEEIDNGTPYWLGYRHGLYVRPINKDWVSDPDYQMGYADGQGDRERWELTSVPPAED